MGVAATAYGCLYLSPLLAGFAGVATLWWATTRWGSNKPTELSANAEVDPAEVRHYREDHPGTSLTAAVRAVADATTAPSSDRAR